MNSRNVKKYKDVPSLLHTSLTCHTTIMWVERSKELNEIMDKLAQETILGAEYTGYLNSRITRKSADLIWPLYEQLYHAIRNVEYEFIGDMIDVVDIQLARKDNKFQDFLNKVTKD